MNGSRLVVTVWSKGGNDGKATAVMVEKGLNGWKENNKKMVLVFNLY